jgi:PncC family amidohydrolase|tara:strand:+ start:182 stop:652 length:471 start_codon:yes stop_codon:yes gene_type:complete
MPKKIKKIITLLADKKINLSIAESCTGGMLAQYITSVNGASKVFNFGIVTYSNQSKIKYLKVPSKLINIYGSVSYECCLSMVENLAKISGAKLNIAITGIAGPNGGTKLKPVGLVFIGLKIESRIKITKCLFKSKKRELIRKYSVKKSLELIDKFI